MPHKCICATFQHGVKMGHEWDAKGRDARSRQVGGHRWRDNWFGVDWMG